jgi:hypothetical protein
LPLRPAHLSAGQHSCFISAGLSRAGRVAHPVAAARYPSTTGGRIARPGHRAAAASPGLTDAGWSPSGVVRYTGRSRLRRGSRDRRQCARPPHAVLWSRTSLRARSPATSRLAVGTGQEPPLGIGGLAPVLWAIATEALPGESMIGYSVPGWRLSEGTAAADRRPNQTRRRLPADGVGMNAASVSAAEHEMGNRACCRGPLASLQARDAVVDDCRNPSAFCADERVG